MFPLSLESLISFLQTLPGESISFLSLFFCFGALLGILYFLGPIGVYIYTAVAVVAANIQVLKTGGFILFKEPVALGTIVFATTYVASDILTEYFGVHQAKKNVWGSFAAMLLMTGFMLFALGHNPTQTTLKEHQAIATLFSPSPALFISSLCAYTLSQLNDVWIFALLRNYTQKRLLWLRTALSISVSALLDTFIFSVLAFVVFSTKPLEWHSLFYTYILGTYLLRLVIMVFSVPCLYLARFCLRPKNF